MLKGRYIHAERCCSYWVPCTIHQYGVDEPIELQYQIDRLYGNPLRTNGAIITFVDEFNEECKIWTELDRVEILGEENV